MSEFSIKGFAKLFELKGYTELVQFYSPAFDFIDRVEAGLERVRENVGDQSTPHSFSMSAYPVWNEEGEPYVSSYFSCRFDHDKYKIESVSFNYQSGLPNGELYSQTFQLPTLEDIPAKDELKSQLRKVTGLDFNENEQKKTRRLRL